MNSRPKNITPPVQADHRPVPGKLDLTGLIIREFKHYTNRVDPQTGAVYRQLAYVSQEEKGKTAVEFENDIVTAVEESEDHQGGNVRIVVPPVTFGW